MRTTYAVDNSGNTTKYEDSANLDNFSKANEDIKFDTYLSANFAHEKLSHLRLNLSSVLKDDMLKALDISLCMLEGVIEEAKTGN